MKTVIEVSKIILIFCLYLSLVRGTAIGLFLPSDELQLSRIDYAITKYMNFLILAGILAYLFLENNYKILIEKLLSPPVILFLAICLISVVFSVDRMQSVKFLIVVSAISLPIILYYYKYGEEKLLDHITFFAMVLCFLCVIYIILMPQYGMMSGKHAGAWRGLFPHKNIFGPFFAITFYFFMDKFFKSSLIYRVFLALAAFFSLMFVVKCQSSTAILGFVLMGAFYGLLQLLYRMPNLWERLAIIIGSITLFGTFFLLGGDLIAEIILQLTGKDMSLSGRTDIWLPLLELSYHKPIFGYGLGMAQRPEFMEQVQGDIGFDAQSTHNSYLDVILGIGYPGTLIFMIFIIKAAIKAVCYAPESKQDLNRHALIFSHLVMMMIIAMTSSYVLFGRSIFWILMLMSLLMLNKDKQSEKLKAPP